MQAVKFNREIDQKLFQALTKSEPNFLIARDLLSKGGNINAACLHPDLGKTFLIAAVFDEFIGHGHTRAELSHFFLDHGFDPTIQNGFSGAHALTNLISYSYPNHELFFAAKALLEKGCNPSIRFLNYIDDPEPLSAYERTSEELFDSWFPDCDFLRVQGFAALHQLLATAIEGGDYLSVEPVIRAERRRIKSISGFGLTHLQTIIPGSEWKYEGEWKPGVFSSGIVIDCEDLALCIDPYQAAFCTSNIKAAPESEKFELNGKIVAMTGRVTERCKEGSYNDTLNIILDNDYCLRIQEDPNNKPGSLKRGTIRYKLISDEWSDPFTKCLHLSSDF